MSFHRGSFVDPVLFKFSDAPRYSKGFLAVLVTACAAALLICGYRFIRVRENNHRDKEVR